ncbi:MAG: PAS domain S-box protein [Chloroflexi bacterium]|nr:PAS domain S-box protein [Chloroflexota bacterium]
MRDEILNRLKMLKNERNFISAVLDTADALVLALSWEGRIVHFNRACEQISGYSFAEVKNRYFWELLPSESTTSVQNYFAERSPNHAAPNSDRIPTQFESYLVTKTGQRRLIAWSNTTLLDKTGEVEYIIATGLDITEQRQAEAALAQERDFLHALMDSVSDAIYFKDTSSRFTRVNKGHARILAYGNPAEAIGKTDFDYQPPELARALYAEEQ